MLECGVEDQLRFSGPLVLTPGALLDQNRDDVEASPTKAAIAAGFASRRSRSIDRRRGLECRRPTRRGRRVIARPLPSPVIRRGPRPLLAELTRPDRVVLVVLGLGYPRDAIADREHDVEEGRREADHASRPVSGSAAVAGVSGKPAQPRSWK